MPGSFSSDALNMAATTGLMLDGMGGFMFSEIVGYNGDPFNGGTRLEVVTPDTVYLNQGPPGARFNTASFEITNSGVAEATVTHLVRVDSMGGDVPAGVAFELDTPIVIQPGGTATIYAGTLVIRATHTVPA